MGKKTKRQQPRLKRKKKTATASIELSSQKELFKAIGRKMLALLKDKEGLNNIIQKHISCIEGYFRHYDTTQLLGSVGLYLIDNLPNLEKYFMARIAGKQLELDEEAEVIAEYALNFGLSMPNEGRENPTDDVVGDLRERLRALYKIYGLIDMPLENNAEQFIDWVIHSETISIRGDGYQTHVLMYQPDDYSKSDKIFWVWPQNNTETRIMDALSVEFGSNAAFIAEGEYKGNIMNGHNIYEKPFVKDDDKFYCFTPMIPHRNLFLIAEKLMKRDDAYYQKNFQQNTNPISRDQYVEGKVKSVMESFLPSVTFYPSVHYNIVEDGEEKRPELGL